jgi:hypothetical protein
MLTQLDVTTQLYEQPYLWTLSLGNEYTEDDLNPHNYARCE